MNLQRLNELYSNHQKAESAEIESLKQLTVDYPYFVKPYEILAKYYYDTKHYKFEEMLRQAAMRVKNRRELYTYIHGRALNGVSEPLQTEETVFVEKESPEPLETIQEKPGLADFLDIEEETEAKQELQEEPLIAAAVESETEALLRPEETTLPFENTTESTEPLQEFEFEAHYKLHEEVEAAINLEEDIIGEEIAAEFSFSKSFLPEPATPELEAHAEEEMGETMPEMLSQSVEREGETEPENAELKVSQVQEERDFFAWLKDPHVHEQEDKKEAEKSDRPKQEFDVLPSKPAPAKKNVDEIIEKFIATNPQISRPKKAFFNAEDMAKKGEHTDLEFVTETLAQIYYEQGDYALALEAYRKLSLQNPSKQAYFANLIEKIKKERK